MLAAATKFRLVARLPTVLATVLAMGTVLGNHVLAAGVCALRCVGHRRVTLRSLYNPQLGITSPRPSPALCRQQGSAWEKDRLVGSSRERERAAVMIVGAHVMVYGADATADRVFFQHVLGFASVDAGQGWLIFAHPPTGVALHPAEEHDRHELYCRYDDLKAEISTRGATGVWCSDGRRPCRSLRAEALHGVGPHLTLTDYDAIQGEA